jgi:hypothetical protein
MSDLSVEVRDRDIIVRRPDGHSITYRRVHEEPVLIALDPMRDDPDTERTQFLVQPGKPLMQKQRHWVGFNVEKMALQVVEL